jgi:hypothetical protein
MVILLYLGMVAKSQIQQINSDGIFPTKVDRRRWNVE